MTVLDTQRMGLSELLNQSRVTFADRPTIAPTADQLLGRMRALNVEYETFDATVRTQPPGRVTQPFMNGWQLQLADWRAFVVSTTKDLEIGIFTIPNLSVNTFAISEQIDQYKTKLNAWNEALKVQVPNVVPVGPPPSPIPTPPSTTNPPSSSSGLPWWVTAGLTLAAVGGLAYVGYSAYRYVKGGATVVHLARRAVGRDEEYEGGGARRSLDPRLLPYPPRTRSFYQARDQGFRRLPPRHEEE